MIIVSIPIGVALAIVLGVARVYGNKAVSLVATSIVGVFRGFPAIVTLFIIFFALPEVRIYFSPYWSAVLGFVLVTGAYQSEYVRGCIQSVQAGQSLAAQALGMSKPQEVIHIILPQALRAALPGHYQRNHLSNSLLLVSLLHRRPRDVRRSEDVQFSKFQADRDFSHGRLSLRGYCHRLLCRFQIT